MGKKIDVYNLGLLGVNVDASPVHLNEGELLRAQNWAVDPAGVGGGLRRRDGHTHLNSVALDGAVKGLIAVPLPDNSSLTRKIYLPYADAAATSKTWRVSTDLTTWTDITTGAKPQQRGDLGFFGTSTFGSGAFRWATLNNKIYYPGHDYIGLATYPTVHVFDGTNDYILTYITPNPNTPTTIPVGIYSIVPYSATMLLISTFDATAGAVGHGRVHLLNVTTGQLTTIGPQTDIPPAVCPFVYQGRVWIGSYNAGGAQPGKVYHARVGDDAWTLDKDFSDATFAESAHGYCYGMAAFKGDLYSGWGADVGSNGVIRKRSTTGAWTTVHTSDGNGAGNFCGPLITSLDGTKIYAFRWSVSGGASPIGRIMSSVDGAAWVQDYNAGDVAGVESPGQPILDPNGSGDILWCLMDESGGSNGRIVQNHGGVYTLKDTNKNYRGPICSLKV